MAVTVMMRVFKEDGCWFAYVPGPAGSKVIESHAQTCAHRPVRMTDAAEDPDTGMLAGLFVSAGRGRSALHHPDESPLFSRRHWRQWQRQRQLPPPGRPVIPADDRPAEVDDTNREGSEPFEVDTGPIYA